MHTGRRLEEGGARPPFDSSRAGMFSVRKAGWSRARGSLKIPMTNVQNIRLLSREELNDLSRKMASQQLRFERALFEVPGLALLVVETWKRRQDLQNFQVESPGAPPRAPVLTEVDKPLEVEVELDGICR